MKVCWQVDWIASVPVDDNGDSDMDSAVELFRWFPTKALAEAFAAKVIVGLPFEVAYVRKVQEITLADYRDFEGDVFQRAGRFYEYVGEVVEVAS